jgi:hypothetical protein
VTQTDWQRRFVIYAVEMGSGAMIDIPSFHKNWFRHSEVNKKGYMDSMEIA